MKLIIERLYGKIYVYKENESQYKAVECQRDNKIDHKTLDAECSLEDNDDIPANDFHMVFNLKDW